MSSDLHRSLAPISEAAWAEIDSQAAATIKRLLAGRKLTDFSGPHGWEHAAVTLGRTDAIDPPAVPDAPAEALEARLRTVQPLVELRVPFQLSREELENVSRGTRDPDLGALTRAAHTAALCEDAVIFHGHAAAGIEGVFQASRAARLTIGNDYEHYPVLVAEAIGRLREAGVDGPYAIALGRRCFAGLSGTTVSGYPVMDHVARLIDGPLVWAPAIDGAVVMSLRGGDFEMTVGQDFSIGYLAHTATAIELYIQESFTFLVLGEEAAVPLEYDKASG